MQALSTHDVVRAVAQRRGERTTVGEIAQTEVPTLGPEASLEEAVATMQTSSQQVVMIVEDSKFVAALTLLDIQGHQLICAELGPQAENVITEISPNDLMHAGSWGAVRLCRGHRGAVHPRDSRTSSAVPIRPASSTSPAGTGASCGS